MSVSQFVAGLIPTQIAGTDGKFEEILVKARLKETKLRNLNQSAPNSVVQNSPLPQTSQWWPKDSLAHRLDP